MMKSVRVAMLGTVLVLGGGGCLSAALEADGREAAVVESTPGEALTAAFVGNDEDAFLALLSVEARKEFSGENFDAARKAMKKSLGTPVSFRYLAKIEHPLLNVDVLAVRFERTGENGKIIHQEALFRVISGVVDEKPQIISFNFL